MGGLIAAHMPGLALVNRSRKEYLASTRKCGSGGQLLTCGSGFTCWVSVYLDGVRIYDATMDLIPAQYNMTGSDCGVLLLWTRER